MKKNLMQTNGLIGRGSRYQPGIVGAQSPVSEENFDDQFLQLDNNVNSNQISPLKEDTGLNALEQALQDHLNKEKYDMSKQLIDNNFEKYHLRIKNQGTQQISENKTAATNSSGANYMNFRSRKLVIRKNDSKNKQLKSAEDE